MNKDQELERQMAIMTSGAAEVIPLEELRQKVAHSIESGKPLRVKMGIDPTAAHVHLGHMVIYRKIRQFQDLGHKAVLIIGDYTARIGDPTGRNSERPSLTEEEVKRNCETYTEQIFKIVDRSKTEVHYQSSWFDKVSLQEVLTSLSAFSVAHMLTHETFRKRLEEGNRLSLHELTYPVLQAWDSLFIQSDVELGGFDQKFNILCGRDLQRKEGKEPQAALFMPLLPGTDGRKMSKTFGNHIPVLSEAEEKFGKTMSISDDLIIPWFRYTTDASEKQIDELTKRLSMENPRDLKMDLAFQIVKSYHGESEAERCRRGFISRFSRKEVPQEMPIYRLDKNGSSVTSILKEAGLASSVSEGKRLIEQGGFSINGDKITDPQWVIELKEDEEVVIKAGKRKYVRIRRNI